jgi:hypothetical protein
MHLILHNTKIIDVCNSYEQNVTNEGETGLIRVFPVSSNIMYFIGTAQRFEYTFVEIDELPEDYYNNFDIDGNKTFYYEYDNDEFIKIEL